MRSGMKKRLVAFLLALSCGGTVLQVSSCSPGVRDAVLQGLETTSTTFANILIQALFEGLGDTNP